MVFKLREARRAMKALDADPDDTEAAIRAIAAMSGGSQQRCFQRFKRSPAGADLLRSRPELFDKINDLDYLGNLPENTLGHAIWAFYTTEELSAAGLKTASEAARTEEAGDTDFGLDITLVTSAASDDQCRALLKHFGMPLRER